MSDHHLEADDGNGDAEGDRFPQSDLVSRIQRLEQLEITPQRAAFRRVAAEMRDIILTDPEIRNKVTSYLFGRALREARSSA